MLFLCLHVIDLFSDTAGSVIWRTLESSDHLCSSGQLCGASLSVQKWKKKKKLGSFAHTNSTRQVISSSISSHIQSYWGSIMRIIQTMLCQQNNINLSIYRVLSSSSSVKFSTVYYSYPFKDCLFCKNLGSVSTGTMSVFLLSCPQVLAYCRH